jgi:flagellar motor protein MotB
MRSLPTIVILSVLSASLCACQNKLAEENKQLWQQNQELQAKLADSEAKLRAAPDPSQVQSMQSELAQRDAEIRDLKAAMEKQVAAAPRGSGFEGLDASYDPKAGTVTVNIPGAVLFASGSDTIKDSAKGTLNTVIQKILKNYKGKQIFVDGHTDSTPISKTKDKWEDNLDLSAARAMAVARYLTGHGVASKNVIVRAFGDTHPKSTLAASRRVEIVVSVR